MEPTGLPARELGDTDLERQGAQAHATRNWVFLHGTAEQYQRHTERMLELEEEYLRRHPKRTWQGSTGSTGGSGGPGDLDEATRLRMALRGIVAQLEALLGDAGQDPPAARPAEDDVSTLLRAVADAPGARLHRLELHQAARHAGVHPAQVAQLYRSDPPLLAVDGADRLLTDDGRRWLAARS